MGMRLDNNRQTKTFEQLLGKKLMDRRRQLLKSQDEVENEASIAYKHLGRIERGESSPLYYTMWKLSEVLNFDMQQFANEVGEEMKKQKD